MNNNSNSHEDVISRFINYGESNFESNTASNRPAQSAAQLGVLRLIYAFRFSGHLRATLDPLKRPRHHSTPPFTLEEFGLSEADLDTSFDMGSYQGPNCNTLRELFDSLNKTYCSSLGVEYMHIPNLEERKWIQTKIETMSLEQNETPEYRKWLLQRITAAEVFEKFLHNKYVGQKRFSLEGSDTLIPLLNVLIEHSGEYLMNRICLGMAHRGRLNVLINIMGKRAEKLFKEFAGDLGLSKKQTGDVKYHQGFSSDIKTDKKDVHLALMFNPSHLELVNPVIEGYARYHQDKNNESDRQKILPVLIHGDAAFSGQGIVMETLNMSQSRGYRTMGTVHIIINNQIGFTTTPHYGRSAPYCTEIAKMVQAPIFHVNGDDPEAVVHAAKVATEFRQKFQKDVVLDIICYRRFGHNEGDEPMFTNPLMYKHIKKQKTSLSIYTNRLVEDGLIPEGEIEDMKASFQAKMNDEFEAGRNYKPNKADWLDGRWSHLDKNKDDYQRGKTAISPETFTDIGKALSHVPEGYEIHKTVSRLLDTKEKMFKNGEGFDWATAEALAFGSLLTEGYPVRLAGHSLVHLPHSVQE